MRQHKYKLKINKSEFEPGDEILFHEICSKLEKYFLKHNQQDLRKNADKNEDNKSERKGKYCEEKVKMNQHYDGIFNSKRM